MSSEFIRFLGDSGLSISEFSISVVSLFPWVEFENKVGNSLGVLDVFWMSSISDFNQSDVLDGSDKGLLSLVETEMNSFLLAHSEDGKLPSGCSASQVSGDDNSVPEVSASVITRSAVKLGWSDVGKDWLLFAGGEVDSLNDLVNLLSLVTEVLESLGPWELSLSDFLGGLDGFG